MKSNSIKSCVSKVWSKFESVKAGVLRKIPQALSIEKSIDERRFLGFGKKCFIPMWLSQGENDGYSRISDDSIKNGSGGAHRLIYKLVIGPIDSSSQFVNHRCGNAGCINPNHLYLGTLAQNVRDAKWHRDARRRLSIQQIQEIEVSTKVYKKLAMEFGVHEQTIGIYKRRYRLLEVSANTANTVDWKTQGIGGI